MCDDLLNERGSSTAPATGADFGQIGGGGSAGASAPTRPTQSETALDLDKWARRRGEETANFWREQTGEETDPTVAADCHAALFELRPRLADNPADAARSHWFAQLMDTPEYGSLRRRTQLDPVMSQITGKVLADQYRDWQQTHQEQDDPQPQPQGGGGGAPQPQAGGQEGGQDTPPQPQQNNEPGNPGEPIQETVDRIRSTAQAIEAAQEAADEAAGYAAAGHGTEGTAINAPLNAKEVIQYWRACRENEKLAQIMKMAGRMIARAQSLQKAKTSARYGGLSGVELAGDVSRLVPSEFAQVTGAIPELEDRALYRLLRKRCLCWTREEQQPADQGPIIVFVDESGSMRHTCADGIKREVKAKALALAMAWIAKRQKRWCYIIGFSGYADRFTELLIDPKNPPAPADVMAWLERHLGGGTSPEAFVDYVPGKWAELIKSGMPRGRTDELIITDGAMDIGGAEQIRYRAWKEAEQVRTYTLFIDGDLYETMDVEAISDRFFNVDDLSLTGKDAAALDEIMSV